MAGRTRRISMKTGELEHVDVKRISLVDRPASRVPFRFTKRDSDAAGEGDRVINFKVPFVKRARPAAIGAVVLSAAADLEADKALLEKAGYKVEVVDDGEGNRVLPQVENLKDRPQTFVKFDDCRGVVLVDVPEDVAKGIGESLDFGENLGASQFIPGMDLSVATLVKTVFKVLEDAENRDAAVEAIKNATAGFKSTLDNMAEAIPADVFKLEKMFAEADLAVEDAERAAGDGPKPKADDGEPEPEAKKDEGSVDGAGDASGKEGKPQDGVAKSGEGDGKDPILQAIEGLGGKLGELVETVQGLGGRVEKAEQRAEAAEQSADGARRALATATGGVAGGDAPAASRQKQVQKRSVPLLDTAVARPE